MAVPAFAGDPLKIASDGAVTQAACGGASAAVFGSRNTVTLSGACAGLSVRGDANVLVVELAPRASVDVEGSGNRLDFTVAGGGGPGVRLVGGDSVLAATSQAAGDAAGPIQLTGDNQSIVLDCAGQAVTIAGNHSRYDLRGGCASVVAHGDGNQVKAALRPGASVEVEGNGTDVAYAVAGPGAEPTVAVRGRDSHATRSAPGTSVPAALVMTQPPVVSRLAQTVHDLGAKIVAAGTLVVIPASDLFGAASDQVKDDAGARLVVVADLATQTHPSAVVVTARDPVDAEVALRRAQAVAAALAHAGALAPTSAKGEVADGPAALEVLLLR